MSELRRNAPFLSQAIRLMCVAVAAVVLAGCTSTTAKAERARVLMSEYHGWTIRIRPSLTESDDRWRARVEVWPPDRSPNTHGGINVYLADSRPDEKAIVQAALESARRYIDASRGEPQ